MIGRYRSHSNVIIADKKSFANFINLLLDKISKICYNFTDESFDGGEDDDRCSDSKDGASLEKGVIEMTSELNVLLEQAAKANNYEEALQILEKAYSLAEASADKIGKARVLGMRAFIFWALGDFQASLQCAEEALLLSKGAVHLQAFLLRKLGNTLQDMGEYDRAIEVYQKALTLLTEVLPQKPQAIQDEVPTLWALARCQARAGQVPEAVNTINQALELATQKAPDLRPWVLVQQSLIFSHLGNGEGAWASIQEAIALISEEQRMELTEWPNFHFAFYKALRACGRLEEAREYLRKSYEIVLKEAARIQNERWREGFLRAAWPNREIVSEWERVE